MQCVFNPKDTNTFASASLDRTVKVRVLPRKFLLILPPICAHTWLVLSLPDEPLYLPASMTWVLRHVRMPTPLQNTAALCTSHRCHMN